MVVVLDASVLAKLFLAEKGSALAEEVVAKNRKVIAPDIARIEVASAITRAFRRGDIDSVDALGKLNDWRNFYELGNVSLFDSKNLQADAERLSIRIRHPLADCIYLSLAMERQTTFFTADEPLLKAAKPHFDGIRYIFDAAT